MLRRFPPSLAAAFLCGAIAAQAPPAPLTGLTEQRLANGADLILVSRPGSGAFRASLFFRQGGAPAAGRHGTALAQLAGPGLA